MTAPKNPQVSVVIVNWNSRELLAQALTTLYDTTKNVRFETIVVDNGSHDDSVSYLQENWPDVVVVSLDRNHGFAGANNIGFKSCKGEYILLLNVDTISLPTTVSGLVECMEARPEAGCVGARHLNADGSLQWSMDDFPSLVNDTLRYTDLYRLPSPAGLAEAHLSRLHGSHRGARGGMGKRRLHDGAPGGHRSGRRPG